MHDHYQLERSRSMVSWSAFGHFSKDFLVTLSDRIFLRHSRCKKSWWFFFGFLSLIDMNWGRWYVHVMTVWKYSKEVVGRERCIAAYLYVWLLLKGKSCHSSSKKAKLLTIIISSKNSAFELSLAVFRMHKKRGSFVYPSFLGAILINGPFLLWIWL